MKLSVIFFMRGCSGLSSLYKCFFFVKNKTVPITEWGIISIMVQQQIHTFTLKLRQTPTYTLIHCLNTLIHFSPQFRKNIINRGGGGCKNRSAVGRGVAKWGHLRFNLVGKHTMIRSQLTRFPSDFFYKILFQS